MRFLALATALLLSIAPHAVADDLARREVVLDGGSAPLHGSLMRPGVDRPGSAILFISGSGPTDRNGDAAPSGVKPGTLRLLAEGLARKGVTSLRFDKRGVGESASAGGAEFDLRLQTYVDDAVAWARYLASQEGVRCVVMAGHSEGALIAAMAAQRTPVCGVVEMAGAGRSADALLADQLSNLPEPLHGQALAALKQIKAGGFIANPPPIPELFRPTIQPYLRSWMAIDPTLEIAKVKAPVLILQGGSDLQVSVKDAKRLSAARPDARVLIIPRMNHVLKDAPSDRKDGAAYADPSIPLDPQVVPAIAAFVHEVDLKVADARSAR